MKWHFRPLEIGETTREPIQGEFFSTDAIRNPAEALIREGIQNSLDAGRDLPVKVRLFLASGSHAASKDCLAQWLDGTWQHIHATGNGLRYPPTENSSCSFLVFEDFKTCGLQGDVTQAFDEPGVKNHFFYFFRAEGRSGKGELDRGRWGVGKHVFPRSSSISTFFGLTVRADDGQRLLMGHTILKSHRLGKTTFSPDGYLGDMLPNKLVVPIADPIRINKFCNDFKLKRGTDPGLSLVVPFVDPDFTLAHLKEAVICGYFYPLLTGTLEVLVETPDESIAINADTLSDVVSGLDDSITKELVPIINLAEWSAFCREPEFVQLKPCNPDRPVWTEDLIPQEHLQAMLEKLKKGERLAIRANLTVREKGKPQQQSHFDVFLWQDGNESGRPLFIREGIIISDVRGTRARGIRSLVVIEDKPIASLLGDSENPAHTQWQKDSSNFKGKYYYGPDYLDFVSRIVARLVQALSSQEQEEDWNLLSDIFSLPSDEAKDEEEKPAEKKKKKDGKDIDDIDPEQEPRKKRFRIKKSPGGFVIVPGDAGTKPPARLDVQVAYDLRTGNPLRKYHPADFRLDQKPILFEEPVGLKIISKEGNRVIVDVINPNFQLSVSGFDVRRDLFVNVKMQEDYNDTEI